MDQIKIGKFIKEKRKEKKITQSELAEKLNVTDRAVSKWETGICMPDSGIIPELCKILGITINDLFRGNHVDKKDNEKEVEDYLLELYKQKENSDRRLLNFEIVVGIITFVFSFFIIFLTAYLEETKVITEKISLLIVIPIIIFMLIMCAVLLRIEQIAGYYECKKCHHRYIPTFASVFLAMHVNRTRYMKCPKCNKYSWNKKVILKGDEND